MGIAWLALTRTLRGRIQHACVTLCTQCAGGAGSRVRVLLVRIFNIVAAVAITLTRLALRETCETDVFARR